MSLKAWHLESIFLRQRDPIGECRAQVGMIERELWFPRMLQLGKSSYEAPWLKPSLLSLPPQWGAHECSPGAINKMGLSPTCCLACMPRPAGVGSPKRKHHPS